MKRNSWMLLPALLLLTGCRGDLLPRARDITTVELMQVLALDEGEGDKLRVTAATGVRSVGQGGEPKPPVVLQREAPTVLSACMSMQGSADGYASFSHVEQVVLSADAAERSTAGLLDFLERDPEMRLDTHVYLTEGKASDVIEQLQKEERSAAELLEGLQRELEVNSQGWPVNVGELLADLEENGCALLPVLEVKKEGKKPVLRCETMGWFQEDDFRQTLKRKQARAAAILKGELGSGVEELTLPEDTVVGLRLTRSKCRWVPRWEGDKLTGLTAQVQMTADLAEVRSGAPEIGSQRERMSRAMERTIKKELEELLLESQRSGADFLHLQRELRVLCPARYREIDLHWKEWFPEMELSAQVQGTVERSYDLNGGAA